MHQHPHPFPSLPRAPPRQNTQGRGSSGQEDIYPWPRPQPTPPRPSRLAPFPAPPPRHYPASLRPPPLEGGELPRDIASCPRAGAAGRGPPAPREGAAGGDGRPPGGRMRRETGRRGVSIAESGEVLWLYTCAEQRRAPATTSRALPWWTIRLHLTSTLLHRGCSACVAVVGGPSPELPLRCREVLPEEPVDVLRPRCMFRAYI